MSALVTRVSRCVALAAAGTFREHTRRTVYHGVRRWVRPAEFQFRGAHSSIGFADRTTRRSITSSGSAHHTDDGNTDSDTCKRRKPGDMGVPIVYHPAYSKPVLPDNHRFPMPVFREIYRKLIKDGVAVPGENLFQPARMPSVEELTAAHDDTYIDKFRLGALDEKQMRKIGLPWSGDLVERTFAEVAGTILTADLALTCGLAVNTAGGTHHAHYDFGSGYCIVNDLAVTALRVLNRNAVDRVLILDLDVHQGDGTARILENDKRVFTLSVHCKENFPAVKANSSLDIALPKGTGDELYMKTVEANLRETLEDFKPQLVLYDAGVDIHKNDSLGGFSVTDEGLIRREALVLDTCIGRGIPVAAFVGGGYDSDMNALVRRHCILHHVARGIYESNKM